MTGVFECRIDPALFFLGASSSMFILFLWFCFSFRVIFLSLFNLGQRLQCGFVGRIVFECFADLSEPRRP